MVYTYTGWLEFEKKLTGLSDFDEAIVKFKRRFIGRAVECAVDGHGRILIPPPHRAYAGITRHVVWSGALDFAELWDKERFEEMDRDDVIDIRAMREALVKQGF
jgi:MraZ protein